MLEKGDFILGDDVYDLESKLAEYVGVKHCISCASGTDAILIPIMEQNIGCGDAVFTTNFSYFATTEVISLVGATPVFVDINQKTFNIDPLVLEKKIKKVIKEKQLLPKAIIAVDLFGQLANYNDLEKIAKKYNLLLIEDGAQSFGATQNGRKSCSFGDVAATSFYPAKPLGCYGDGGAIFTNDSKKADNYRSIRVHGQGIDKYDNIRVGLNSRLDTIQATVLLNKLEIFDDEIKKRNHIASYYSNNLHKYLKIPFIKKKNTSSWAQYSLLAKNQQERDSLVKFLGDNCIPTAVFYKKIFSDLDFYLEDNIENQFNISKKISECIFSIPMHPYLKKNEQDLIIDTIIKFFKR